MMVTQPPSPPPPPLPPPPMSRQAVVAPVEPLYANSGGGGQCGVGGRRTPSPAAGATAMLELPPNLVIMNTPPTPGQEQV